MTSRARTDQRGAKALRKLTTPEGVPLHLELADVGDRASAFILDMLIVFLGGLAVILGLVWVMSLSGLHTLSVIIILLFIFFLRNFYFIFFELRWSGRTPGKRKMGLRVIDRDGK